MKWLGVRQRISRSNEPDVVFWSYSTVKGLWLPNISATRDRKRKNQMLDEVPNSLCIAPFGKLIQFRESFENVSRWNFGVCNQS